MASATLMARVSLASRFNALIEGAIQEALLPVLRHPVGWVKMRSLYHHHRNFFEGCLLRKKFKEERPNGNISRLYARRILDIAMASAASKRAVVELEEAIAKPADWHHWERRDWTDDLLAAIGGNPIERSYKAIQRLLTLTMLAAPLAVLGPLSMVSNTGERWCWDYAIWCIEKAGPTYIKAMQWASTRQDLFSPAFCLHFGRLRDNTTRHSWDATQTLLEEELGEGIPEGYLQLDPEPIGSGCIAQVYRGHLKQAVGNYPEGSQLAIKVQHPGIWRSVCLDFYILGTVARFLEDLPYLQLKYLSLQDTVRQFRDTMLPQLDLTLEAKHLQRFNRDFGSDDRISFPRPVQELTSTKVLTETFVHGTPIMDFLSAPISVREELANLGLEATMKMIFLHDFLHGDLHPGNMLVSETESGQLKLHLLDCGLVVEMGPEQHVNLVKVFGAFTRMDGRSAARLMVDMDSANQANDLDISLFIAGVAGITTDIADSSNIVERVGDFISDICFLACRHKVKLESTFINAALAVEIVEGIATALHPNMCVQSVALPMVIKAEMMHKIPTSWIW